MTFTMFDSVNAGDFPNGGFDATAGYVNGRYASSAAVVARFPGVPHLDITVRASGDARCLDVEPGDATPDDVPAWLDRQYARGEALPVIYCNKSLIGTVRAKAAGRPFLLWSASYTYLPGTTTYFPHIDPGADATQWADHGPNRENVDQTLMSDAFYRAIAGQLAPTTAPGTPPVQEDDMTPEQDHTLAAINAGVWDAQQKANNAAVQSAQTLKELRDLAAVVAKLTPKV